MVDVMGRVPPPKPGVKQTDYSSLFGFGQRGQRVNPHEHAGSDILGPDLSAIVRAARKKEPVAQSTPDPRSSETTTE
jgi:hypothetical protein